MMYFRAMTKDMVRNKGITITTTLFIAAAAMLVSLAVVLTVNLAGAIDSLMVRAETPHFMQMHSGPLDMERLTAFAEEHEGVDEFQVMEFINIDGSQIVFEGGSLRDSVQDNGITVQSEQFDFLLDMDGNRVKVSEGELYIPITYLEQGLVRAGEKVKFLGKEYTAAGFIRDSQMTSLLSSSKRFLMSEKDHAAIGDAGNVEYLIEFRLHTLDDLGTFENDYTSAGLAANGPTITYPLFRMVNALSDGLMIAVILLVSALIVLVAFLCIRFTLLAKIEDDYREIGVMKAIGLRVGDIKKIYLAYYTAVAALGALLGFGLSFVFQDPLLENIRLYMGEGKNTLLAPFLSAAGISLVFLVIILYVYKVLGRFRNIPPAEAIRFGSLRDGSKGGGFFLLSKTRLPDTQLFLGLKDVLTRKKIYATMLAVLVVGVFIITVPRNLYNTISSEEFLTYMGTGKSDLRIDLQQIDGVDKKAAEIAAVMENDPSISRFTVLTTKTVTVKQDNGPEQRLKIELGDHSVFPLTYSKGRAPAAEDQIALSVLNARELDKGVGEVLKLIIGGREQEFVVSGIYSDVTNGGKTAKGLFTDASAQTMWSVISAELSDTSLTEKKVSEYTKQFPHAKVSNIDEFISQTYGPTITSIGKASVGAIGIAMAITMLITILFMRMLISKDSYSIAIMKSLGFTNGDIKKQYAARSVSVLIVGILVGTVLANTLGELLAGTLISSFGVSSFSFAVKPLEAYIITPLLMVSAVLAATVLGTLDAGKICIAEYIKE